MSIPTDAQLFSKTDPSKPDVAFLKNHFYREGRISEEHALYILEKGTDILRAEPNLLYVDAPVTGTPRAHIPPTLFPTFSWCLSLAQYVAIFTDNM